MQEEIDIYEIARIEGLDIVSTTDKRDGYPSHVKRVLTDFYNFDEAREVAEKYDLELIWIDRRDGWQLYHRGDKAYAPLVISSERYGDNYNIFYDEDDWLEFQGDLLHNITEYKIGRKSLKEVDKWLQTTQDVLDLIDTLGEEQGVLYDGYEGKIIDTAGIYFNHDSKIIKLAAIEKE